VIIDTDVGLQTAASTWYLAVGLLALWLLTLPILVRVRDGWEQLLGSLVGMSWVGFGFGIVLRFFLLAYDAVTFSNPSTRLTERPSEVVDLALLNGGVYWVSFVAAALATHFVPVPRLVATLAARSEYLAKSAMLPITAFWCLCIVGSVYPGMPAAFVTPFGLLGSMWVVSATLVWVGRLSGTPTPWPTLAGVLVPGLLRVVLSPYREYILVMLLVPLTAAAFANRRLRLSIIIPTAIIVGLLSTVVIVAYRQVAWYGQTRDEALSGLSFSQWQEHPFNAPWSESLRRFHVFDSLLLTVDLVPDVFPFSGRNLLLEGVTNGVIPRLFNSAKQKSEEGLRFQTTIWSFDDDPTRDVGTAAIAPSMPGSLYEAGGIVYVALGALVWAAFLAMIDRLKSGLLPSVAAAIHVLAAVQAFAGIERDYTLAFSTLLQTFVVFFAMSAAIWRISAEPAPQGVAEANSILG
jgi:hypothetical protein